MLWEERNGVQGVDQRFTGVDKVIREIRVS